MRCGRPNGIKCSTQPGYGTTQDSGIVVYNPDPVTPTPTDCNPYPYRPLNKDNNANERLLQQNYWWEYVNHNGTRIEYFVYNYATSAHDYLYGEQPTATFSGPYRMNMITIMPQDALLLSKFGLQTNNDLQTIVAIKDFRDIFGPNGEPKSGDLIRLVEAGWRSDEVPTTACNVLSVPAQTTLSIPITSFIRCPQLFEITERNWQDFSLNINPLLGHYVWGLKAKRFDYSYQPGIIPECKDGVVGDDTLTGILTGGTQDPSIQDPSPEKPYPGNADSDTKDNIWDYQDGSTSRNTNPYGEY